MSRSLIGLLAMAGFTGQCAELSVASISTLPGVFVAADIRLTAVDSQISALQFDIGYRAPVTATAVVGPSVLSAGKSFYSAALENGGLRCLIAGVNQNSLPDGVLVSLGFALTSDTLPGVYPLQFTNLMASNRDGMAVPLTATNGSLTVGGDLTASAAIRGTFTQIVSGGAWKTSFTLMNLSPAGSAVRLTFWNYAGTPQAFSLTYPPDIGLPPTTASAVDLVIPANGLTVVETEAPQNATPLVGWARVQAPAGIVGSAVLRQRTTTGQEQDALVPLETRVSPAFIMPFDNTAGFITGVAFSNSADTGPADITVTARDVMGRQILTDSINLPVRGHGYFSLPERYASLAGLRGSLEFRDQNGNNIAVVGLLFNPSGAFTSIPVVEK